MWEVGTNTRLVLGEIKTGYLPNTTAASPLEPSCSALNHLLYWWHVSNICVDPTEDDTSSGGSQN